jgi:hypothetical protein
MEKSSQIAWIIVPLRHFSPLKVVPLIEVFLYSLMTDRCKTFCVLVIKSWEFSRISQHPYTHNMKVLQSAPYHLVNHPNSRFSWAGS